MFTETNFTRCANFVIDIRLIHRMMQDKEFPCKVLPLISSMKSKSDTALLFVLHIYLINHRIKDPYFMNLAKTADAQEPQVYDFRAFILPQSAA